MIISDELKALIVKMQGSGKITDFDEETIAQVIHYMAENWDSIKANFGGGGAYTLPAASKSTLGGVKTAAAVSEVSAPNASDNIYVGYNQQEVQAIATLANANKAAINELIISLKTAGVMSNE